jgi:hypothetical protein
MTSGTNKLLAGALLAGMGIVTGEATLIATAAGVGVNWLAEGLAGLWPNLAGQPSDALTKAYAAAIRDAVHGLEDDYRRTVDAGSGRAAFHLVAACADAVAGAELPVDLSGVDAAQRALEASLAALLYGHDEREIAFLRQRLLPACAAVFQQRLVQDATAWRAFHGLVLQALAANSAALLARLERFTDVLAAWSSPQSSLAQLQRITAQLAELASRPAAASRPVFDNRGMRVGGSVHQAAGDQYFGSAHAQGGGAATVVNTFGAAPSAPATTAESAPITVLFLAANPLDTPRLRVDQEARRMDATLRQGRHGERFHLAQQWAVRPGDLLDALLRYQPAIVHFSGHGSPRGEIVLEDEAGRAVPTAPAALAALCASAPGVRCVLLNACWSDALATALLDVTACVVGMTTDVQDVAAIAFAAGFYRALAEGLSVAAAVTAGHAEVAVEGGAGAVLTVQVRAAPGVDPSAMRFAGWEA